MGVLCGAYQPRFIQEDILGLSWFSRTGSVYLYLGLWGHPRASSLLLFLEAGFRGRPDGRDIRVDFQGFVLPPLPAILISLRLEYLRFFRRLEKWIPDLRLNRVVWKNGMEE